MFAMNDNKNCEECLRILKRDGVADGYRLDCKPCRHGVICELGKRRFPYVDNAFENSKKPDKGVHKENDRDLE